MKKLITFVVRSVHTNNSDLLGEMAAVYGFNANLSGNRRFD